MEMIYGVREEVWRERVEYLVVASAEVIAIVKREATKQILEAVISSVAELMHYPSRLSYVPVYDCVYIRCNALATPVNKPQLS